MLKREEIRQGLDLLRKKFPGAFPKDKFVVLKKGIALDICKSSSVNMSRTKLRTLLIVYTGDPEYIQAHVEGANRYDLEGNVVGQVTAEEYSKHQKFQETRLQRKEFLKKVRQKQNVTEGFNHGDSSTTNDKMKSANFEKNCLGRGKKEYEPKVVVRKKRRSLAFK